MRTARGTVKWWRDDKGHGVIACAEISPWDIWCHFSAIQVHGFKALSSGQTVEVDFSRTDQESFKYVARRVRPIPERARS
ncbi:MAG: cold shock domain-containing protein [Acidobacteria bacterium]|nr:MAG: cold shock domain-containing protein [Acidobacteriota bacterium]